MSSAIESQGTAFSIQTVTTPSVVFTDVGEVVSFSGLDGSASEIDVTSLESTAKEFLMGLQDWGGFKVDCNYLASDDGQEALRAAKASREIQNFKLTLSDDSTASFSGYVLSASLDGGVDSKIATSFDIRISGDVTFA
jgi:predicted secreted protein